LVDGLGIPDPMALMRWRARAMLPSTVAGPWWWRAARCPRPRGENPLHR